MYVLGEIDNSFYSQCKYILHTLNAYKIPAKDFKIA